jgi:hypothetical protein
VVSGDHNRAEQVTYGGDDDHRVEARYPRRWRHGEHRGAATRTRPHRGTSEQAPGAAGTTEREAVQPVGSGGEEAGVRSRKQNWRATGRGNKNQIARGRLKRSSGRGVGCRRRRPGWPESAGVRRHRRREAAS